MPAKRTGTRKARAASRVKRTMKGGGGEDGLVNLISMLY